MTTGLFNKLSDRAESNSNGDKGLSVVIEQSAGKNIAKFAVATASCWLTVPACGYLGKYIGWGFGWLSDNLNPLNAKIVEYTQDNIAGLAADVGGLAGIDAGIALPYIVAFAKRRN